MPTALRSVRAYADAVRLIDAPEMVRALRHDVSQYDPPATADEALVSAVDSPYSSVHETLERLGELTDRLVAREDRRAVFLTVYTRMTDRILARLDRGEFHNPAWMRTYTTTFANYYRRAFLAFERGELGAVPDPWRIAFGTAARGDALVVQDAFLGINAHINYDLALTLRDVGLDPDRTTKRADHRAVDAVLARLVDVQQRTLAEMYAAGIADIDAGLGRLDERLSLAALTEGREQAWRVAVVLSDVRWPPAVSLTRWVLRATATGGAALVRNPAVEGDLLAALRRFELEGVDVGSVVETLGSRLDAVQ